MADGASHEGSCCGFKTTTRARLCNLEKLSERSKLELIQYLQTLSASTYKCYYVRSTEN